MPATSTASAEAACHAASPPGAGPRFPDLHLFETDYGPHLLLVDGSRVFSIGADLRERIEATATAGRTALVDLLEAEDLATRGFIDPASPGAAPLHEPPLRALSLAVAQKCNLGCTYCYADGGGFGGPARDMSWPVAEAAVRRLVAEAAPGERLHLAFLGGEPLTNRALIRRTTEFAAALARAKGALIGFAITTNGTLLRPEDADLFERYGFAVTVSIDGVGEVHDRLRPTKAGRGSYARLIERVRPLLAAQERMQLFARVSVTPRNLDLPATLEHLIGLGFKSVGFAPVLSAPTGRDELERRDLAILLDQMIACGRTFERSVLAGERYPFSNMLSALTEIHRGTHRPYPCGAGAGYFGVSAEGGLYACHRFVDDAAGALGDVGTGVDRARQRTWLAERAVDHQAPCRTCWARHLCGGGCHHEVIRRGRPSCDYIRGWLHYVLQAYVRLSEQRPAFIQSLVT
jgi:uncharacterized protein